MTFKTETPITREAANYIMRINGWKHIEGTNGNETIQSPRYDENERDIAKYNRFERRIEIYGELHAQELLAIMCEFRII